MAYCKTEYPIFYYFKKGVSDKKWIFNKLRHIKKENLIKVSREYERIYTKQGRKAANVFLHNQARRGNHDND